MPSKFPGLPANCSGGYIDCDNDLRSGITIGGAGQENGLLNMDISFPTWSIPERFEVPPGGVLALSIVTRVASKEVS